MVKLNIFKKKTQTQEELKEEVPTAVPQVNPQTTSPKAVDQMPPEMEQKPKLWKKIDKEKILHKMPLYDRYKEKKNNAQFKYAKWKESLKQLRTFGVGFQYGVCFGIPAGFYRCIRGGGSIRSLYRVPLGFGMVLGTALYTGTKTLDSLKNKD